MIKLIRRNLLLYYNDISNVLFSFLGMAISLLIYTIFLKNTLVGSLKLVPDASKIIDTWMIAGLISIVAITSPLSSFGQKIEDRREKSIYDQVVNSRLSLSSISNSYVVTAVIEGMFSTLLFSAMCYIYLMTQYKYTLSIKGVAVIFLYILVLVLFASVLFSIVTIYIKSNSGFASLSAVVGTLTGFLSGSYIIFGDLPKLMQGILRYWPGFDIAGLLRNVLMPITNIPNSTLKNLGVLDGSYYLVSSLVILVFVSILGLILNSVDVRS